MQSNPKVSIIVAVYNVENYLRQGLDSLINQTLQDIEIICVNDGSTDGSLEILNEYASKDSRVKIINQPNQGPGVARNNAIKTATGDYIMIMDPDDWYELDACEVAYNQISKNKNDFVIFNAYKYFEQTGKKQLYNYRTSPFRGHFDNPNINLRDFKNYIKAALTWAQIYSREFIVSNNIVYADCKIGEDVQFWVKVIVLANTISVIEKPLYNYRIRLDSITTSYPEKWSYLIKVRYDCLEMIKNLQNGEYYIAPFTAYSVETLLYWYDKSVSEKTLTKKMYNDLRGYFINLKNNCNLAHLPKNNYLILKNICKTSYEQLILKRFLQSVVNITNTKTHKVITFFGIKIKFRRSKQK